MELALTLVTVLAIAVGVAARAVAGNDGDLAVKRDLHNLRCRVDGRVQLAVAERDVAIAAAGTKRPNRSLRKNRRLAVGRGLNDVAIVKVDRVDVVLIV